MKKEEVKVIINSKKEAKQIKAILTGLGERVDNMITYSEHIAWYFSKDYREWCMAISIDDSWETISIRELIMLLTHDEYEPKKQFIMMSEDGISLCVGDKMYGAKLMPGLKKWQLEDFHGDPFILTSETLIIRQYEEFPYLSSPQNHKAFSTKEAAEKWIEKANKPKSIIIGENSQYPIIVTATEATIKCMGDIHKDNILLRRSEVNEIADAFGQLNAK